MTLISLSHMQVLTQSILLKLMLFQFTSGVQEHLSVAPGVVNSQTNTHPSWRPADDACTCMETYRLPLHSGAAERNCTVTVNFPDMMLVSPVCVPSILENIPSYSEVGPQSEAPHLPEKLQPPPFRVHRCHHSSVEQGDDVDAIELPTGFPEAVQHISETPFDVSLYAVANLASPNIGHRYIT